jgi:N-acylneuraminate cytidylyltransferase
LKILGLITARGGSKSVPGKNIKPLAGKPLLHYTAEVALKSEVFDTVYLSTDDLEIAECGKEAGIEIPFMRPKELAQDNTPTLPVIQNTLDVFETEFHKSFDAVCLLQPTSPLRKIEEIKEAVKLFEVFNYDCLLSMMEVPHEFNPHWVYFQKQDGLMYLSTGEKVPITRRQDLPKAYCRDGALYITKTEVIKKQNSLFGERVGSYVRNLEYNINIDTLKDWEEAEKYLANNPFTF